MARTPRRSAGLLTAVLGLAIGTALAPSSGSAQTGLGGEYRADGSFSLPDEEQPGSVAEAASIAIGPRERIFIADREGAVHVFAPDGTHRRSQGDFLEEPLAVAVARSGRTIVLDRGREQMVVLDPGGEVTQLLSSEGSEPGSLDEPVDLTFGPEERIYVLEEGGDGRVSVFAPDGAFLRALELDDTVEEPSALAVGHDGSLYVSDDDGSDAVWSFPPFPTWPWSGTGGASAGEPLPLRGWWLREIPSVEVNRHGTIIVADGPNGTLLGLNRFAEETIEDREDTRVYGSRGRGRGAFERIADLAMAGDDLYVLDREIGKVEHVRLTSATDRSPPPGFHFGIRVSHRPVSGQGRLRAIALGGEDDRPRIFTERVSYGAGLDVYRARTEVYATPRGDSVRYHTVHHDSLERSFVEPETERPGDIAVNDTMVAVTQPERHRFILYDRRDGDRIGAFGDGYRGERRLRNPRGIGLLSNAEVAVADRGDDRVKVFSPGLDRMVANQPLVGAHGLVISPSDEIYAWNEAGTTVVRLSPTDDYEARLVRGGSGGLGPVADLAVDGGGNLFVLDPSSGRVTIRRPDDLEVVTWLGARDVVEEPGRLALDREGNIYVDGDESRNAVVYRWSVRLPGPDSLRATYATDRARLSWAPHPAHLVREYRLEGAARREGPFRPLRSVRDRELEVDTAAIGSSTVRYVRVRPISVTADPGRPSRPVPVLNLTAAAASRAGDHDRALADAEEALRLMEDGEVRGEADVRNRLARLAFEGARELGRAERALGWGQQLLAGASDREKATLLPEIARLQLDAGLRNSARSTLVELAEVGAAAEDLGDSAVVEVSFDVAGALGDTASHQGTIRFLEDYVDRLPRGPETEELRATYRDSISVYRTRDRFGQGFRLWRNTRYGQALEFFEAQLQEPDLGDRQEIVARQILAAIYFAYGRRGDARAQFEQILEMRPEFEIDERAAELESVYGLSIYNSSMREVFHQLKAGETGS